MMALWLTSNFNFQSKLGKLMILMGPFILMIFYNSLLQTSEQAGLTTGGLLPSPAFLLTCSPAAEPCAGLAETLAGGQWTTGGRSGNVFWNAKSGWAGACFIILLGYSVHSPALTSCKTEQTPEQSLSAETNHVNDNYIKQPKRSKQCISVGTAHRASAGAISPCQHCALLTVLWAHRILGSQADRPDLTTVATKCRSVCSL